MNIQEFSEQVSGDTSSNVQKIDPISIATIMAIISALVGLYKGCQTPAATVAQSIKSIGVLERWHLSRVIKSKVKTVKAQKVAMDYILKNAPSLTVDDITEMYDEV